MRLYLHAVATKSSLYVAGDVVEYELKPVGGANTYPWEVGLPDEDLQSSRATACAQSQSSAHSQPSALSQPSQPSSAREILGPNRAPDLSVGRASPDGATVCAHEPSSARNIVVSNFPLDQPMGRDNTVLVQMSDEVPPRESVASSQLQASSPWSVLRDPDVILKLCANLRLHSNFLTGLKEAKLISFEDLKKLKDAQKTREYKLNLLLNEILPMCSPNKYVVFCEVLEKTNRKMLSDKLIGKASSMGWRAPEKLPTGAGSRQTGQLLSQPMARHVVESARRASPGNVQHGIIRQSARKRTVFVTVYSKYLKQYDEIKYEVQHVIEETFHPKDKAWQPLIVKLYLINENLYDMNKEQSDEGVAFQEKTPVKFSFPAIDYGEEGAENKGLLVELLTRNIAGLVEHEITFVGGYPNGLAYVITIPGDAALRLFCLLRNPLPQWSFASFGPVKVKFHGLPSIEMKFQTSGEILWYGSSIVFSM